MGRQDPRPFRIILVALLGGILCLLILLYNKNQTPKLIPVIEQPTQPEKTPDKPQEPTAQTI